VHTVQRLHQPGLDQRLDVLVERTARAQAQLFAKLVVARRVIEALGVVAQVVVNVLLAAGELHTGGGPFIDVLPILPRENQ
jgi:hypothetical protein